MLGVLRAQMETTNEDPVRVHPGRDPGQRPHRPRRDWKRQDRCFRAPSDPGPFGQEAEALCGGVGTDTRAGLPDRGDIRGSQ